MKINNILTIYISSIFILTSCHNIEVIKKSEEQAKIKQIPDEVESKIVYNDQIFKQNIKTLLCHKKENNLSLSIINLNSDEKLLVSFDDLEADIKDYYYSILHCNSNWEASDLIENEYIKGFISKPIVDYQFSFNTMQKYTHYQFEFPSTDMKPILSGNYIFKIYENDGNIIAYKRFMVLDKQISIEANVRRATLAADRNTKHEIDFNIKHPKLTISDPFSDIKVHVKQNNKNDNAITHLTPIFVKNNELKYDYENENTFWGNNEYRYFDIKSLRFYSERIKSIKFDSSYNHVHLFVDKKRSFDRYSIQPDINGKFLIKSQEGWDSDIEADYTFVHFNLSSDFIDYGDIYLIGGFSDWQLKEEFKLKYNTKKKQYTKAIYLKQGYYNYLYALNDTTSNEIDISFIEGTHYETRNDYYIYVYYKSAVDRHESLIGFLKTSSKELF